MQFAAGDDVTDATAIAVASYLVILLHWHDPNCLKIVMDIFANSGGHRRRRHHIHTTTLYHTALLLLLLLILLDKVYAGFTINVTIMIELQCWMQSGGETIFAVKDHLPDCTECMGSHHQYATTYIHTFIYHTIPCHTIPYHTIPSADLAERSRLHWLVFLSFSLSSSLAQLALAQYSILDIQFTLVHYS